MPKIDGVKKGAICANENALQFPFSASESARFNAGKWGVLVR